MRERPEENPHENREQDNADAVVGHEDVERIEQPHHRIADPPPHAELHHVAHPEIPQQRLLLRSHVEDGHALRRNFRVGGGGGHGFEFVRRLFRIAVHRRAKTDIRLRTAGLREDEEAVLDGNPTLPPLNVDGTGDGNALRVFRTAATTHRAAHEVALERRIAVVAMVHDVGLGAFNPRVNGKDVVVRRTERRNTERQTVGNARRFGKRLFQLNPVVGLERDLARGPVVLEHDEICTPLRHLVVGIRRQPRHALHRERRCGREIEHERRIFVRNPPRALRVLEHPRTLHHGAARRQREFDLVVLQRFKLFGGFRLRGRRRRQFRHLGGGRCVFPRRNQRRVRSGLLALDVRDGRRTAGVDFGVLLLFLHRMPHPANQRKADDETDDLVLFVHTFRFSLFQIRFVFARAFNPSMSAFRQQPLGGTGS